MRGPGITPGSRLPQVTGNVDILPTIVELAVGKSHIPADVDGHSLVPFLLPGADVMPASERAARRAAWRDHYLSEYLSVGTYYNDHSQCWSPPGYTEKCGGSMPRGPDPSKTKKCVEATGVGDGNCYFVDSTHSNSWRALRIINSTMNVQYIEYDPTWHFNVTDPSGAGLQHYELYDLNTDKYQVKNLYAATGDATRRALHAQLASYWNCGSSRTPCP